MNELSLFSGAGGGLLGTKLLGFKHIGYVEWDEYCQQVISQRIKDGLLDEAPIFTDVREFAQSGAAREYRGFADVVTAGFPCQPFSTAARGRNIKEKNRWDDTKEVIKLVSPRYVFLENVNKSAIDKAGTELCCMGYTCKGIKLSASDLGADHIRARYWLLAYTDNESKLRSAINAEAPMCEEFRHGVWATKPRKSRMVDGNSTRVDRYRATGNMQIPIVAATAWRMLND